MIRRVDLKKAAIAGVAGAVAMELTAQALRLAGLPAVDLVSELGSLPIPNDHGIGPAGGILVHAAVGIGWALFYAYFFWARFRLPAVVQGLARGYTDAGLKIGVYSTPHLWQRTVGDLALGVPEWRAAGHTSRDEALSRCGADWQIQGGDAVFGQWVAEDRDHNVTCPAVTSLTPWFHQY